MNRILDFNAVECMQYSLAVHVFGRGSCLSFIFAVQHLTYLPLNLTWEVEIQKGKGFSHTVMKVKVNEVCRVAVA